MKTFPPSWRRRLRSCEYVCSVEVSHGLSVSPEGLSSIHPLFLCGDVLRRRPFPIELEQLRLLGVGKGK